MKVEKSRTLKNTLRTLGISVAAFAVVAGFQNCGSPGDSGGQSASTSPNTPPPGGQQPQTCPRTSNPAPSITNLTANAMSFNIGMGRDAGTENTKFVTATYTSGDNFSGVVNVTCQVPQNSGLQVNCQDPNTPQTSGTFRVNVSAANGAECLSGSVTVTIRVEDVIVNAQNAPIGACGNLEGRSQAVTLTVNRQNTCLPTQRVNPTTPYSAGQMGNTVAADGNWALAIAPGDEEAGQDAGAAFVMRRNGNTWSVAQKLIPDGLGAGQFLYGGAIAGNLIALGSGIANLAWIYEFNGTQWVQRKVLTPPAGAFAFGQTVAISGTTVAVGAPLTNDGLGANSGAVYVFSGADWNSVTTLRPSGNALINGQFGFSLAYSGTTLAVGAPYQANPAITPREEAVYIFNNNVLAQKLINPRNVNNAADKFGFSISFDGNNLLVGAPWHTSQRGIAYLFQRQNGQFPAAATRQYVLADPSQNAANPDHFGYSVAVRGGNVVVGAPNKAEGDPKFGAVYLFSVANNNQIFKIRSPAADRDADSFGTSVGLTADGWMISGALNDEHAAGIDNSGSVYFVDLP